MSRLATFSAAAKKALLAHESDDTFLALLTLTGGGLAAPIRLANGYLVRLSETAEDEVYGLVSRSIQYVFVPFSLALPSEEDSGDTRCRVTIPDATREVIPQLRSLTGPPDVLIELVLRSTPDVVEASFPGLVMAGASFDRDAVSAELAADSYATEPFPCHTFTPSVAPGLF